MNRDLGYKIRTKWATKLLDWTEALPSFNGGTIAELQSIRKHQRTWAERESERTRMPKDLRLTIPRVVLLQTYPIEEFDHLDKALRNLFPGCKDQIDRIRGEAAGIEGWSWHAIGHLARTGAFLPLHTAVVPTLPAEIRSIAIDVHRILPSLFVVAFTVSLRESFTDQLHRLNRLPYLGRVDFQNWLPFGRYGVNHSEESSDVAREEAMLGYLAEGRQRAERVIKKYFPPPGYARQTQLPAIEEFHLKWTGGGDGLPADWLEQSFSWGAPFGLRTLRFDSFKSEEYVFQGSGDTERDVPHPNRLIVMDDQVTSKWPSFELAELEKSLGALPCTPSSDFTVRRPSCETENTGLQALGKSENAVCFQEGNTSSR